MNYQEKVKLYKQLDKVRVRVINSRLSHIELEEAEQLTRLMLWENLEYIKQISNNKKLALFSTALRVLLWQIPRKIKGLEGIFSQPAYTRNKKYSDLSKQIRLANKYIGIEDSIKDADGLTFEEVYLSDNFKSQSDCENKISRLEIFDRINRILKRMPERDEYIIKSYYGLDNYEMKNMRILSKELGISFERVSQRIRNFYKIARKYFNRQEYEL